MKILLIIIVIGVLFSCETGKVEELKPDNHVEAPLSSTEVYQRETIDLDQLVKELGAEKVRGAQGRFAGCTCVI